VQTSAAAQFEGRDTPLLRSIAEQLKTPLTIISRQIELEELKTGASNAGLQAVRTQAGSALTLVESYLLGLQLLESQTELTLEPVSVSSLLVDVAHELQGLAKVYGTELELHIAGKYQPVMAHPRGLRAALLSLGYTLLESYPLEQRRLSLAVHRTPHGIVTGLYGNYEDLSSRHWRQALELQGRASQPFSAISSGSGAGIFVAQTILQAMTAQLRVGKHRNQHGLAATLQPSQQLQFV